MNDGIGIGLELWWGPKYITFYSVIKEKIYLFFMEEATQPFHPIPFHPFTKEKQKDLFFFSSFLSFHFDGMEGRNKRNIITVFIRLPKFSLVILNFPLVYYYFYFYSIFILFSYLFN